MSPKETSAVERLETLLEQTPGTTTSTATGETKQCHGRFGTCMRRIKRGPDGRILKITALTGDILDRDDYGMSFESLRIYYDKTGQPLRLEHITKAGNILTGYRFLKTPPRRELGLIVDMLEHEFQPQ